MEQPALSFQISTNTKVLISVTAGLGVLGVISHYLLRRRKYPRKTAPTVDAHELGFMGMEALATATNYWEEASAAHYSAGGSAEHSEFHREVKHLLQMAYSLQEQSRLLFCDGDAITDSDDSLFTDSCPSDMED